MQEHADILWVRKNAAGRFERDMAGKAGTEQGAEQGACCGGYCGVFWQAGPTPPKARELAGESTIVRIGLPSRFIVPLAVFVFLQPALAVLLMLALSWGYSLPVGIISALVAWRTIRIVKRHIRTA